MSSFAGLHTALSGLVAQRYGLDVTGANVANANTPGYSRQRAVLDPSTPVTTGTAVFSRWDGPGTGVRVTDLQRVADELVVQRVRQETSTAAFIDVDRAAWSRLEVALGEPGDNGLQARLSGFWAAWEDLANSPGSTAARSQVLQVGTGVTDTLNTFGASVAQAWTDARTQVGQLVAEVNATAAAVADLNSAIRDATAAGGSVNELLDRRDQLVLRLSELTGATVRPTELGMVDVFVGGTAVVRADRTTPLALDATSAGSIDEVLAGGAVRVTGAAGAPVDVAGGRVGALLDSLHRTWPGIMRRLDATAADVAARVDAVHSSGQTQDGAVAGAFFTSRGGGPVTARTIAVGVTDTRAVAAAAAGAGALDGSLADRLSQVGNGPASPDAAWRRLVGDVGSAAQSATRRSEAQSVVVRDVNAAREAASGVDIDEELTNMVMFQRAYEGAARMLTAVDEALDTLINRTGLVGR
ncbi:flagellar hook-associated protein FlgK [Aquipuribacter nitratireducens]|uniref:Flagellar hook-associated protein 1 n=1 Tax=Aquipuribacter nitratireducens TaxID=650104 RepID=A0ABW0GND4_9MICO